jgi:CheY-like chemotaxis protein
VSLPSLLLVDDSEAVLAFERAALSGHYALSTATNGREALQKIAQLKPAAVLLDLSMPQMDGDEVLEELQRDDELRGIPVIIVSSERRRAEECLRRGARAFLPKPIRAKELLPLVSRVLEDARSEGRRGNLAVLFVGAGGVELGLPLESVQSVLHMVATRPVANAPACAGTCIEIRGELVRVLDLPGLLGVPHGAPIDERKLVLTTVPQGRIALCVDWVRDPIELAAADVVAVENAGAPQHPALQGAVLAVATTLRGQLPIVAPHALLPAGAGP